MGLFSNKSDKARQEAAASYSQALSKAGERNFAAGMQSKQEIVQGGQQAQKQYKSLAAPTPEQQVRLSRYQAGATTPGETTLASQGPISDAVQRAVLLRAQQPGYDFNRNQEAYATGITDPLVAQLKARGLFPQPGADAGLAGQQYFKGAEPQLAAMRQQQINQDIGVGQQYGQQAFGAQQYYTGMEAQQGEAMRTQSANLVARGIQAAQEAINAGQPFAVQAAMAMGLGQAAAEQVNQLEVQARYARSDDEKEALGRLAANMLKDGIVKGGINTFADPDEGGGGGGSQQQSIPEMQFQQRAQTPQGFGFNGRRY